MYQTSSTLTTAVLPKDTYCYPIPLQAVFIQAVFIATEVGNQSLMGGKSVNNSLMDCYYGPGSMHGALDGVVLSLALHAHYLRCRSTFNTC